MTTVIGGVPTKTLGLPDEFAFDGWGRRFTYLVDQDLTDDADFGSATAGSIEVRDASGAARSGTNTNGAAMAIISHGPNGHGAYIRAGTRQSFGTTNADELQNCNCTSAAAAGTIDHILVQKMATPDATSVLGNFDDVVRYKLRSQLDLLIGGGGTTPTCPIGYTMNGSSCYKYVSTPTANWANARIACQADGGDLAMINDAAENTFVKTLFNPLADRVWIGATDAASEGTWLLANGSPMTYIAWPPGQPDNGSGAEHCLHYLETLSGGWNDWVCGNAAKYVCEKGASSGGGGGGGGSSLWTSSGTNIYNANTGSVGIGTTTPAGPLHVASSNPVIRLQDTGNLATSDSVYGYMSFRDSAGTEYGWVGDGSAGSNHIGLYNQRAAGGLVFGTAGTEKMHINAAGDVGIGRANPTYKLDVISASAGIANFYYNAAPSYPRLQVVGAANKMSLRTTYFTGGADLSLGTDAAPDALIVKEGGNVGIGTTAPIYKLDVAGNIGVTGAGGFIDGSLSTGGVNTCWAANTLTLCSSDRNIKDNISALSDDAVSVVRKLRPVLFDYKEGHGLKNRAGFIAQEVQPHIPQAVHVNPADGNLGWDNNAVLAYVVKAVQELDAKIESDGSAIELPTDAEVPQWLLIVVIAQGIGLVLLAIRRR